MRLTIFFLLFSCFSSIGQKQKWKHSEIKDRVNKITQQGVVADSLDYVDSTCTYWMKGVPFTGYVIHSFDDQYRYNRYENGEYYGEEWIFSAVSSLNHPDSIYNHLKEFRIRTDTNNLFTLVTTYYDFSLNQIESIYIDNRYECAWRVSPKLERFDVIFGGDDYRELPFKSYYENGNLKEFSVGIPYLDGERITYYENGKKESVIRLKKQGQKGILKEFDADGKCQKRLKFRNNKIRGVYVIMDGKFRLSCIAKHQLKKQKRQSVE